MVAPPFSEAEVVLLLRGIAEQGPHMGHARSRSRALGWEAIHRSFVEKGFLNRSRRQLRAKYYTMRRTPVGKKTTDARVARFQEKLAILDEDEDDDADAQALLGQGLPAAAGGPIADQGQGQGQEEETAVEAVRAATQEAPKVIGAATQQAVLTVSHAAEEAAAQQQHVMVPMDLLARHHVAPSGGNGPADDDVAQDDVVVDTTLRL